MDRGSLQSHQTSVGTGLPDELPGINPRPTLLVIPYSGDKTERGDSPPRPGLRDVLATTGAELRAARERVRTAAKVDERRLMPAIDRYTGGLYKEARAALGRALDWGQRVVILSGGNGAMLPAEPIEVQGGEVPRGGCPQRRRVRKGAPAHRMGLARDHGLPAVARREGARMQLLS